VIISADVTTYALSILHKQPVYKQPEALIVEKISNWQATAEAEITLVLEVSSSGKNCNLLHKIKQLEPQSKTPVAYIKY